MGASTVQMRRQETDSKLLATAPNAVRNMEQICGCYVQKPLDQQAQQPQQAACRQHMCWCWQRTQLFCCAVWSALCTRVKHRAAILCTTSCKCSARVAAVRAQLVMQSSAAPGYTALDAMLQQRRHLHHGSDSRVQACLQLCACSTCAGQLRMQLCKRVHDLKLRHVGKYHPATNNARPASTIVGRFTAACGPVATWQLAALQSCPHTCTA